LAEAGANLIILSRTKGDLNKVEKTILKLKRKCTSYVCDVTEYEDVKRVFKHINSLDIVVNNAGTNRPEHFTKIKKRTWSTLWISTSRRRFMSPNWAQKLC